MTKFFVSSCEMYDEFAVLFIKLFATLLDVGLGEFDREAEFDVECDEGDEEFESGDDFEYEVYANGSDDAEFDNAVVASLSLVAKMSLDIGLLLLLLL